MLRGPFGNVVYLGLKELRSFLRDTVLLGFVVYAFSFAIIAMTQSTAQEVHNAAIAIVDEDHSPLSRQLAQDFLGPEFLPAAQTTRDRIDMLLDEADYTFLVDVPPHFQRDVEAGRSPGLQVNVDATAAMQAGIGAGYVQTIAATEIARFAPAAPAPQVALQPHISFNPNALSAWFTGLMGIINNITMLAIILSGAAVLREREHGTMDHLMVMPLSPFEIALAKIWANALVITAATGLSLTLIVHRLLSIPIEGSVALFLCGVVLYLFFATAIGILLATVARSMPQLGLLYMLVSIPMNTLSGGATPLESMPPLLQKIMQVSPSTHFVSFGQAILFRGAGLSMVWPDFVATGVVGLVVFWLALLRFRSATAQAVVG